MADRAIGARVPEAGAGGRGVPVVAAMLGAGLSGALGRAVMLAGAVAPANTW